MMRFPGLITAIRFGWIRYERLEGCTNTRCMPKYIQSDDYVVHPSLSNTRWSNDVVHNEMLYSHSCYITSSTLLKLMQHLYPTPAYTCESFFANVLANASILSAILAKSSFCSPATSLTSDANSSEFDHCISNVLKSTLVSLP